MIPTTLRTVAADLSTQILAITPDYPLFRARFPWKAVEKVDYVPGEFPRLYHCQFTPLGPVEDGIFGDAVEYQADLRIWTSYRNLPEIDGRVQDVSAEMIDADGRQLWVVLQERVDPVVDGLVAVLQNTPSWTYEDEEPGSVWGSHDFTIRYLLSHQ